MNNSNTNRVVLSGTVKTAPSLSHEAHDEKFYLCTIECKRLSGNCDTIPVIIPENLQEFVTSRVGKRVEIIGSYRSYNIPGGKNFRLMLVVFGGEANEPSGEEDINEVNLTGYICKAPIFRTTPFRREISDMIVAVNRGYRSDYIPCIAWGKNARLVKDFSIGTKVDIIGRVQSREYIKRFDDGTQETRTAYEISITSIFDDEGRFDLSLDECYPSTI